MKKKIGLAIICSLLIGASVPTYATELYEQYISDFGNKVSEIKGREFKFLIDPKKVDQNIKIAFKDIWFQTKTVLEKNGLRVLEREKKTWALKTAVKTFFDTPNMDLWKKGYLIRTTTTFQKNRYPETPIKIVVKRINQPFNQIIQARLSMIDNETFGVIEDNVGVGSKGQLVGYIEKTVGWSMGRGKLGEITLADISQYVPELSNLGISPQTELIAHPAFSTRCRPGYVEISGLEGRVAVSMEAWSHTFNGKPFIYDFSLGYEGDFINMKETHRSTEKAFKALSKELGTKLGYPNADRYVVSKVRVLLNQPR
ncbi:MAG: hypothetical protein IJ022_01380 [Burkholderiaceae bacterium]|nr:hypothetical protein [Burkholderiaceae bacterium]